MKIISSELTKEEWEYLHEVLLFQRLLDQKHRRKIDDIRTKALAQIEWIECKENNKKLIENIRQAKIEDEEDKKYRRKITK